MGHPVEAMLIKALSELLVVGKKIVESLIGHVVVRPLL
jgi:hypothetical protein